MSGDRYKLCQGAYHHFRSRGTSEQNVHAYRCRWWYGRCVRPIPKVIFTGCLIVRFKIHGRFITGLTVASRLAEEPSFSIAVIEAGPDAQNDSVVNDPAKFVFLQSKIIHCLLYDAFPIRSNSEATVQSAYSWRYYTTPQGSNGVNLFLMQ